jgi:ATP-dependent Clp protease protease subunit
MNNFDKFSKNLISSTTLLDFKNHRQLNRPKSFTPMIIEERQMNASTISVFDRLMMDRIIFLGEEIDDCVANIINAQLLYLDNENSEPIWLYINSPGGEVYSGLAIYDTMQAIKTPVHTCVMGLAASMAFVLGVAGEKKHRFALKHSRLMQHQPLGGIGFSQATDIEIYNTEMQNIKNDLIGIISHHTKQDKDIVRQHCERDNWMTAAQAVEYNAIDKIITQF